MPQGAIRVVILGATSGIAEATARLYAKECAAILLAGRRAARLEEIAADLRMRGAMTVETAVHDFVTDDPKAALSQMREALGGADHVLVAYGLLGEHNAAEHDIQAALDIVDVNFRSAAAWVLAAAEMLEERGAGSLVVLGSVAGDRGRRRNYIYGAAKAGLATLVEGIAHRFAGKGPRIVVVKPGPTDTRMLAGLEKKGPLVSQPEQVAAVIRRAADRGGPVVYAPARWRWIMMIIRAIPAPIFNQMDI